ncbi:hypothetical protein TG4357_01684 [Thalassovita gelatinovora]|uniref:DUF302 domain-containing protein n=1 Tax=Thalassovita gelatinovora TaxID=53501 RepID=A0A0P1FAS6_THAGE|nr:hypothetical protein [Thalassovita gelatinovora]QIZ80610.1 DUF302 domain-containing protein [Thalassovita gelatinovora]CUH65149.1 hypothetical protein TG4357_01684 [Thalassovita gelatinovora]SER19764.1 hypothetical protein SAMN04488043_1213 [Thalassovita gelatinovora]
MKPFILAAALAAAAATTAFADGMVSYSTEDSFEDVVFGLENAILDQGLVIDAVSHVGEMLERTRADVGSNVTIFTHADVYSFCSANLSRKVMEADPMNIRFCPYDIFVAVQPDTGKTTIGYREFPDGPMQEVQALVDTITRAAIGMD